ncbi:DUF6353 family protein [Butyrivibrio sp. INlla21]|uniref:DUF6353 family protein n=1 Tax=Butyrivibrio sp. INlla21 TaxID=1520811 RepID=UPI0008F0184B|nr:DUF6353 family protein [Butyrivibrio sp. INlla21]SFU32552.1 hypothetical protein SAMN02910342_00081 [Butyrivibrio sp. INlla21]
MNKNKIREAMPTVLFISGIAGIFVSEIMAARDTLKAEKVLTGEIKVKMADDDSPEPYADNAKVTVLCTTKPQYAKEVVKATWKCYIPTLVSTILTCTALIASNRLTAKQVALLSSAVASGGALVQKYRKQIVERFGEEPLKEIDKAVAQATLKESNPPCISTSGAVSYSEFDPKDGDEECLFFDPFTKIKFRSTKLAVFGAKYYLNRNFALGGNVPLEMFYNFLGIELPEEYKYCEWDCDILAEDGYVWIDIDFTKSDEVDPETGEQYYIIEYGFDPGECEDSYYPLGNPMETEGEKNEL